MVLVHLSIQSTGTIMKYAILLSVIFYSLFMSAYSQKVYKASWEEWSDSLAYVQSQDPIMKEPGPKTDSISQAYNVITAYMANGQYYLINNLADYYLWFGSRYPELFDGPFSDYYWYYSIEHDYAMADFIRSYYKGKHYPIPFKTTFWRTKASKHKNDQLQRDFVEDGDVFNRVRDSDLVRSMRSNSQRVGGSSGSPKTPVKIKQGGSN